MFERLEKKPFTKIVKGKRVQLRLVSPELTNDIWDFINRDHAAGGELYIWVKSKEDVAKYVAKEITKSSKDFDYFICLNNKVVGTLNVHTINYLDHKAEIGYSIEKSHEGKGLVSEAVQLIEPEMKRLGFNKLIISCDVENIKSRNVALRNNYNEEGILLQDCIENGKYRDSAVYGKIL